MRKMLLGACSAISVLLATQAGAQDTPYSKDKFLLGDWGGLRTDLHDDGIDFLATYTNELAHNTQGGRKIDTTYADQWMLDANVDLAKLAGLKGASFHATVTNRSGRNLNTQAGLGTLLNEQEIYGYGTRNRIVQFYYQQKLLNDRLVVKLGRLPESGDIFPFSCKFQNLTFCGTVPGYVTPNWYVWPVSQWGASAHAKIGKAIEIQASIYQVNPAFANENEGLNLGSPGKTTGYLAVGELIWKPTIHGLPGSYRVGVWRNTGDFSDVYRDQNGQPIGITGGTPRMLHHASSYYLMAEQKIIQKGNDPDRGVTLFANFVRSDRKVSTIESVLEGGFFWTGPLAARPKDEIGLAIGRLKINGLTQAMIEQQNQGLPPGITLMAVPHVEYPMEVYYGIQLTPAITTRPNVQYIVNPGGVDGARDVVTLGLKTTISF